MDAISEGREFLKLITDVSHEKIDNYPDHSIEAWLIEMNYRWNGQSWMYYDWDYESDLEDQAEAQFCQ